MRTDVLIISSLLLASCTSARGVSGLPPRAGSSMRIVSAAFPAISVRFTCDGPGISPPISLTDAPKNTRSVAMIMDDPDANGFVHWVAWNLPISFRTGEGKLPKGVKLGKNSGGGVGYYPPCPPSGSHRYRLQVFALDAEVSPKEPFDASALRSAMRGHTIGQTEIEGQYARSR